MKSFIGNKKQIKLKRRIETTIKVIGSPIWIPLWLLAAVSYYIVYVMEYYIYPFLTDVSDVVSSYIAKKLSK